MVKQLPSVGVRGTPPRKVKAPRAPPAAVAAIPLVPDTPTNAQAADEPLPPGRKRRSRRPPLPPLLMEPYDGLGARALRDECVRRRLGLWASQNRENRKKPGLMQLLREDDQRRAAQHASAQRHQQDLAALERGADVAEQALTPAKATAAATPMAATSAAEGTSFLSPTAAATPASAAAANATVLYPPRALLPREPREPTYLPERPLPSELAPPAFAAPAKSVQPTRPPPDTARTASPLSAPTARVTRAAPTAAAGNPKAAPGARGKAVAAAVAAKPVVPALDAGDAKPMKAAGKAPQKPPRSVRARRSCHFRLINVMLSPEFNARWREVNDKVVDPDGAAEVNQFWLDVHVAFMSVNQLFDGLHFHDELFGAIDPSVILAHQATRLRVMWHETVAAYQRAVASAKKASEDRDSTESFFDSCAKRLDLLYLHMGLLLEPKLSDFVLKMPTMGPHLMQRSQRPLPAKSDLSETASNAVDEKPGARGSLAAAAGALKKRPVPSLKAKETAKPVVVSQQSVPSAITPGAAAASLIQNAALTGSSDEPEAQSYALVVSGEVRDAAFESFPPHALGDDGYGSSDYDGELPPRSLTPRKRRRSGASTDIVEFHSTQLVPHPASGRVHSTALATRSTPQSSEALVPLDEWDILEGRIRKVNESLDRCHRALSGADGHVSESHRMTLESDLRFYSAIKQRLQEQLLMVMQGF
ncbi:hypothetical protein PybrP1_007776 [[Pythium] brassicae (nom. inval.)]|nr:hypothetical protein PybrP1_007776 [[Pythium] brassicae (nom. inval.)]